MEKFIKDMFAKGMSSDEIAKAMTEALNAAEMEQKKAKFGKMLVAGPTAFEGLIDRVKDNTFTVKDSLILYYIVLGREDPDMLLETEEEHIDMLAGLLDSFRDLGTSLKKASYSEPKVVIKNNPSTSMKRASTDEDIITAFLKSF